MIELSLEQGNAVMTALGRGMGDEGFSVKELDQAIYEVKKMVLFGKMAEMIFEEDLLISVVDGEVRYQTRPGLLDDIPSMG